MRYFLICLPFLLIACSQTSSSSIGGDASSYDMLTLRRKITKSADVYTEITKKSDERVPPRFVKQAKCIAILPGMLKAAFIAGANHGYGVVSCRTGENWSEPAFITMTGGSFGFQIGAEKSDVVLLLMDEKSKRSLLSNQMTLGVDVGIAAGPVGEKVKGHTNADLTGILAYAKSQGVFAGLSLEGSVISPDGNSNKVYYGRATTVETILLNPAGRYLNPESEYLLKQLS